ncbi:hypothetical protein FJTKL_09595 [Diaporthe vaccinii]|uniref:Uncharacterized protein n=1 Tax=Diaporthe vaccinii TaxID=105482 RepID=A0ABR4EN08_9PEZI
MYPLTIQGHFDGGNSAPAGSAEPVIAPGDYRVIFTDAGVYLGVVRYRPGMPNSYSVMLRTTPRNALRASWLAPVDLNHQPIAAQDEEGRWNYPGVPIWVSQRPENFLPPLNMALASVLLARWDWLAHRGSRPPPKPRQDMPDPPRELPQPQLDNGTLYMPGMDASEPEVDDRGFYQLEWNPPSNNTTEPPAEDLALMNCRNALVVVNRTYQVSCESLRNPDTGYLDYHIAVTGTGGEGYHANGWCKGIINNIYRYCGWWFNLKGDVACSTSNATLATFFMDSSIRGDFINHVSGTEMYFTLRKPWYEPDNMHECIAKGIQRGSCASEGIMPTYPVVCRRKDWTDIELSEWDWSNFGDA